MPTLSNLKQKDRYPIRSLKTVILALFIILLAPSCSYFKPELSPIRIGINAWPGYEFLYLAKVKGLFEQDGLDVQIVEFDSLSDGRRAYQRGNIDVLACTLIEHLQILNNSDRSPRIGIVADFSNGADVAFAQPSVIEKKSIKGASVGLEIDSLGVYMLLRMLEREGLSLDDVTIKPMVQSVIKQSFCSKEIDIAITYPPASIGLARDCDGVNFFNSSEIPNEIIDIVVFDQKLIDKRSEEVEKITNIFFKAQDWAFENQAEAFAIMGEREGLTADEFSEALNDGLTIVKRADQAAFFANSGLLDSALAKCDKVLRLTHQLSGSPNYQNTLYRKLATQD